ncbi:MAG: hypothetical protein WBF67_06565, partial [Olleya sp.]
MNNKKNIDRLFQEKFKEFDVKPDSKVWQNIQSQLKEKEDRPLVIIPLWLKLSGIAASLALLLFLGKSVFYTTENSTNPTIVDTEKTKINTSENKNTLNEKLEENNSDIKENTNNSSTINNSKVVNSGTNKPANYEPVTNIKKTNSQIVNRNKTAIRKTNTSNNNYKVNNIIQNKNNSNTTIAQNSNLSKNKLESNNNTIDNKNSTVTSTNSIKEDKAINTNKNNTKINDAVAENNLEAQNNKKQKPSIEDAIAENKNTEDLIEKEEADNRWNVNANIAPVYYNTFGEGSHIHEQFNENNKSGEINTSYGVKVGYALNDKLTVRSGINRLNLSYDTDDVIVFEKVIASASNNTSALKNVDFVTTLSGQQLSMISANNVNTMEVSRSLNAAISQRMNYFEVPLEVEYKLLDNKFGVNLIGGVSTFILNDNQVVSELNGTKTTIGEANNINPISFSTNLGIGLNYKFSNAVIFNIEPTFKYQLNAFSETSGSFNPYIIGLYT